MDYRNDDCLLLVSYIAEECPEEERIRFERHLLHCPSCRKEVRELKQVWTALALQAEEEEVPADLKAQVMGSLFPEKQIEPEAIPVTLPSRVETARRRKEERRRARWKRERYTPWFFKSASAVLLGALLVSLWGNVTMLEQLMAVQKPSKPSVVQTPSVPAQVMKIYALESADAAMDTAKGTVWLLKQGEEVKIVGSFEGLAANQAGEAYQVWLIHEGQRRNAGTFQVDPLGNGAITYRMENPDLPFDSIGITLEPDSHGTEPRGKKVLGT
ncbi:anti-sigma factor [Paenibacillus sp. J2TS4]|uniref:anti-sigma factor n=1 Tax=Paenibacillus sp. J2TS4 TaxID=2807194 RepID=UPI001B0ECF2F|nr:anti-sigma factor [Paenibacillus sp. J2TS4]GIP33293.1 hypothetical protein J2TS4_25030 [Paenibacillus sp. J2TS4]